MQLIWYNADAKEYKVGFEKDYKVDSQKSNNPDAYTVLMEFEEKSGSLASKIMRQLNRATSQSVMYVIN